jgi:eukaryotic-like serine/threonine-protein kinase
MTQSPIQVGHAAPRFTLQAIGPELGEFTVRLDDYQGRWLALLFYPRDFSFVCPTELTAFSARLEAFQQRNCALLGVSIDSLESHLEWMQTSALQGGVRGLRFALAADEDGQVCKRYHVWRDGVDLPNRGIFLIDPDGILKYSAIYDLSVGRDVDEVLHILDALNSGGLCPANWSSADGVLDIAALLKPGRVLGHYRIEAELGTGTFGVVLRAFDLRLHRRVALKVFHKNLNEAESRLLSEARAAAGISHPNVCMIYNVDVIDGIPTIVMEYLEGNSLDERINASIDENEFLMIAEKLASGLAAAHTAGLVHRDLKPGNIVFRADNEPVIVDFGLAAGFAESRRKLLQESTVSSSPVPVSALFENSLDLTETVEYPAFSDSNEPLVAKPAAGKISGTLAYMSPEQALRNAICPASDVFSLALIFVEMLTGHQAIAAETPIAAFQFLSDPNCLSTIPANVPEKYRGLVSSMLAIDPAARPTMEAVIQELQNV